MDWGEKRRYEEPRPIYLNKDNIGGMNECHEEDGDFTAAWRRNIGWSLKYPCTSTRVGKH